jgi:sulfoxide reductase catalytic subunit YedY
MLIKQGGDLRYSDITPKSVYVNRRQFLMAAPAAFLAARAAQAAKLAGLPKSPFSTTEPVTDAKYVTTYNNFYEFGTSKNQPSKNAQQFRTSPWTVSVEGDCAKPRKFSLDEIMKIAPIEERIYRHRCVEAWSIVVPWAGYSLSELLKQVQPTAKAKFVAFESYWDLKQMPLARPEMAGIQFPYVEGLRLDEAMHPLTMLTVGMYGETLPPQDGAPVRLVVPWKYGFKSIKSIVKIKLVGGMPPTTWNMSNAQEYGFYSNVNPNVDHPRWSQATEQRLPSLFKNHKTLMFNGYGDQVASLYAGMDLKKNY